MSSYNVAYIWCIHNCTSAISTTITPNTIVTLAITIMMLYSYTAPYI